MPNSFDHLRAALADRYLVERELGRGGTATVYQAVDLRHDRQVAIKVLNPELASVLGPERFLREIRTAARLTHPHILPLLDSGEAVGSFFYVMPYVGTETLRERLKKEKQLPVDDAVRVACEVADALSYAHAQGVIHRDIKPENVLLESGHAVVADFGIARAIHEGSGTRLTETGIALGTPAYMSPEQASGSRDLDGRSDLYSLGCLLYELLAGVPPFSGPTAESLLRQHLVAEAPSLMTIRPLVPAPVAEALTRALAKAPADRFNAVAQFRDAISSAKPPAPGRPAPPDRRRSGSWMVYAAGSLVLAVIAALIIWSPWTVHADATWTIIADVQGSAPTDVRDAVKGLLQNEIDLSGVLLTLPNSQVRLAFERMLLPDTTELSLPQAQAMALRGGVATVIEPTLDLVGSSYTLTVRVHQVVPDSLLTIGNARAENADALFGAVIAAVDGALSRLTTLGFPSRRRASFGPPTPSLAAYEKWRLGSKLWRNGEAVLAKSLFREAIAIDSAFAYAWCWLAVSHSFTGDRDSADAAFAAAFQNPERLPTSYGFECRYNEAWHRGDYPLMHDLARRTIEEYGFGHNNLALVLSYQNRYEEAIEILRSSWAQLPFGPSANEMDNAAMMLTRIGAYEAADSLLKQMPINLRRTWREAALAGAVGQWDRAAALVQRLLDQAGPNDRPIDELNVLAGVQAVKGQISASFATLTRSIERRTEDRKLFGFENVLLLSFVTNTMPRDLDLSFLESDTTSTGRMLLELWAIQLNGRATSSERSPPSTQETDNGGRLSGNAALSLVLQAWDRDARGDPHGAIRVLSPIRWGPLLEAGGSVYGRAVNQLMEWTLADAFEKAGMPDSAVVHFKHLADRPADLTILVNLRGLTHSFANRRTALLYGQLGQREHAKHYWRVFLNDFTDPDPNLEWMRADARAKLADLEAMASS